MLKKTNKKAVLLSLLLPVLLVVCGTLFGAHADESSGVQHGDTSIPDEEIIKIHGDKIPEGVYLFALCNKMAPVYFSHKKHAELEDTHCAICHHKEPRAIKKCSECHVYKPEKKEDVKYQNAFHKQCHACHKSLRKGKEGPPVKCIECHLKKNSEAAGSDCPKPKE